MFNSTYRFVLRTGEVDAGLHNSFHINQQLLSCKSEQIETTCSCSLQKLSHYQWSASCREKANAMLLFISYLQIETKIIDIYSVVT